MQADQPERRRSIRFPLQMQVSFRPNGHSAKWFSGKTLNISSSGILVQPAAELPRGQKIQMMVDWPEMLDGKIPLRLMVQGRVVRSTSEEAAIHFERFEFRTAKEPLRPAVGAA